MGDTEWSHCYSTSANLWSLGICSQIGWVQGVARSAHLSTIHLSFTRQKLESDQRNDRSGKPKNYHKWGEKFGNQIGSKFSKKSHLALRWDLFWRSFTYCASGKLGCFPHHFSLSKYRAVGAIIGRKFPDTELNFYTFPWQSRIRDNVLSFISTEQLAFSFMKSLQKKNLYSHRNLQMYSRVSNNRT